MNRWVWLVVALSAVVLVDVAYVYHRGFGNFAGDLQRVDDFAAPQSQLTPVVPNQESTKLVKEETNKHVSNNEDNREETKDKQNPVANQEGSGAEERHVEQDSNSLGNRVEEQQEVPQQIVTSKSDGHKIAGLSCQNYGGPSDDIAAEMIYWSDIPEDANFVSPYQNVGPTRKYLTFEPDEGGWNNIRMAMETAVTLAHAMGRTLVMPPERGMYLLNKKDADQKNRFTFTDFFHFESVAEEHRGVEIISLEEFLNREIMTGNIVNPTTGQPSFPPGNRTNWNGVSREEGRTLDLWLRKNVGVAPIWHYDRCVAAFPAQPDDPNGPGRLDEMLAQALSTPRDKRIASYVNNPTPVDAPPLDRLREMIAHRGNLCTYAADFHNSPVFHVMGDNDSNARLLVHFYAFLFFEDWKQDLWTKRFVRDHLRYIDEIQCAAARVIHAIREKARENGQADGSYDSFHIRRGDFQYKDTRVPADVIFSNTQDVLQPGSTIYIATDEKDRGFFDIFHQNYKVYFLDDFQDALMGLNTNYYGMLDQLIASRGRTFIGTFYSTFTGYINRVRGYHSQKDKAEGFEKGVINSYYYIPKGTKLLVREYHALSPSMWSREFPVGWRDIDHGLGDSSHKGNEDTITSQLPVSSQEDNQVKKDQKEPDSASVQSVERLESSQQVESSNMEENQAGQDPVANAEGNQVEEQHEILQQIETAKSDGHKIAGLSCQNYGGPSDDIAAEMIYWSDIPVDAGFVSPYQKVGQAKKYFTFEPDEGGWNNIRMAMETAVTLAHAMGRTLVMPPERGIYLLGKKDADQKNRFTFADFFHFESMAKEHRGVEIISLEEFLNREIMTGNIVNPTTGQPTFPPGNRTNWNGMNWEEGRVLDLWLRQNVGVAPIWDPDVCVAAFPALPDDPSGPERIRAMMAQVLNVSKTDRFASYINNPTPVDAPPLDRLREMMADRVDVCVYDEKLHNAPVFHVMGDNASNARLLVHFYAFLFFEDWKQDLWTKRFIRDHLRYIDEIQCAAARVIHAIREKARENGQADGSYDSFHIRRGDFQYKDTRLPADEIFDNTQDVLEPGSTIYIATDERDMGFFDIFRQNYKVYFLDDFQDVLMGLNTNYYGMLDQLIASRGRTFIGTFYSTFTGYINRVRGYHSQMDKAEGHEKGIINSYYFAPKDRKLLVREYRALQPPIWGREFPVGWRDIDRGIDTMTRR